MAKQIDKGKGIIDGVIGNMINEGSTSDFLDKNWRNYVDGRIDSYPPGYRFCPTDQELVVEYLMKKVLGKPLPLNRIMDVNFYSYSPQELSEMYELKREEEWYFFTSRNKKYPKGNRPNRAAGNGYWKASGADINILSCDSGHILGYKKPLVFCEGPAKSGIKTDWKMQEYRLDKHDTPSTSRGTPGDMKLDDWVLCKIYQTKKVAENIHRDEEDEEMQVPTPDEVSLEAAYPDNNQQYLNNGGREIEFHHEDSENPGNIRQYQHNQGMEDPRPHYSIGRHEFPDVLNCYNHYGIPNPRPFDNYYNGSVGEMQPLGYPFFPEQFDSIDWSLFS
ncbi:hypothetical protein Vadar_001431 [Vaccinium darrowii]|uniref:Uncharacterized protein n=1 Tax=Vaccinium darrowii TaxID=229202 RepID=A0ACB7XMR3_9ERIC|nr:hypothetical protein Vadar_001431 [Vaccinium darrowii]